MRITDDVDRVPPAQGTTHADESVQGLGGFVSGMWPAPVKAHWNLMRCQLQCEKSLTVIKAHTMFDCKTLDRRHCHLFGTYQLALT